MIKYNSRTVDEIGRVVFPFMLRDELCLDGKLEITLTPINSIVLMLIKRDGDEVSDVLPGFSVAFDELGRITLPKEIIAALKLSKGDGIKIFKADSNTLVLRRRQAGVKWVEGD